MLILKKSRGGERPGWASLGYINDNKHHIVLVDNDKAVLIKKMFEVFAKGDISVAELRRSN